MERWKQSLAKSIYRVEDLPDGLGADQKQCAEVALTFPFRVTPYYLSLIRKSGDPIFRQCVPDAAELSGNESLMADPLNEDASSPVPNLVHRYPDRCLFLVSDRCAMYCRFCTRKRKFGNGAKIDPDNLEPGFRYIEKHREIRDVLLSGGDPFLLDDDRIEEILKRLRPISHVEIIRIGTRTPCVLPERITPGLVRMLKRYHPLFVNVHFNHPDELTSQAVKALGRLADAGIPLGSQTVLLKGVNDTPEVMKRLMRKLLAARVRPYYIFQTDLVYGTEHFRTSVAAGLKIMESLRGWTSGLAVPQYVIDLPHGGGKIPLVPEYLEQKDGDKLFFRNFAGERYEYPDISDSTIIKEGNQK